LTELNEKAKKVFALKYSTGKTKIWKDKCRRIADYISSAEKNFNKTDDEIKIIADKFYNYLHDLYFLPGGRIIANADTEIKNLANCFVLSIDDSRKSIYGTLKDAAEVFADGGGLGYNFSHVREEGAEIKTTGGKASGPLSFMSLFDQTGEVISQASRRGAQLGVLNIDHPDIEQWVGFKYTLNPRNKRLLEEYDRNLHVVNGSLNGTKYENILEKTLLDDQLTHFNISVMITDEFMNAVKEDKNWNLISPLDNKVKKTIKAKDLLYQISRQVHMSGDPGILNYSRLNEDNLAPYMGNIESCNPCLYKDTLMIDNDHIHKIYNCSNLPTWKTGTKNCIKLKTNAGHEIIVTPEHKIMLDNNNFIEAKDSLNKNIKWGLGNNSYILDKNARILGFLFGDGFICGGRQGIGVKLNKNKENEIYNILIEYGFNEENCGALYFNKISLENKLKHKLDFLNYKTWEREIPDYIMSSNLDFLGSFVSGLFEANGSVTKVSQISFKTACEKRAKSLQIILASFGIESWIVKNKPSLIHWENGNYTSKESFNLQIAPRNSNKFKEKIGFISKYKNDKIKKLDGIYKTKLKVTEIEDMGELEVWDFKADMGYGFANGFIVHNCGEVPLIDGESCILTSINLHQIYDKKKNQIDYDLLKDIVKTVIIFLDDVTEISQAPIEKIDKMTKGLRRVSCGVLGFSDLLVELNIAYDSVDAINLSNYLSWFISFHAWETSFELAKERGAFPFYNKNKCDFHVIKKTLYNSRYGKTTIPFDELKDTGVRNVATTGLPPTGSIAIIGGVNSSIEPFYLLAYKRNITEGIGNIAKDSIFEINPALENKLKSNYSKEEIENIIAYVSKTGSLKNCNLVTKEIQNIFKTANEINWKWHVDIQVAWQEYISNAISKTVNVPENVTIDDIFNIYVYAFDKGVKGITIFRDNSKSFQILERPKQ
jgi:ribonucleoside-diphosphate reductase alpha chain